MPSDVNAPLGASSSLGTYAGPALADSGARWTAHGPHPEAPPRPPSDRPARGTPVPARGSIASALVAWVSATTPEPVPDPWATMDDGPAPPALAGPLPLSTPLPSPQTPTALVPAAGALMDIDDGATSVSSSNTRGRNKARPIADVAPVDLPAGRVIATWPLVNCAGVDCGATATWRDCFEECIYTKVGTGVLGDDEDAFQVSYFCFKCMAGRWGCDEADALTRIRDGRWDIKRRREKNIAFNAAAASVVAAVPAVSKNQRRLMAIDVMKEAMGPIARFVRIKTKMLQQRSALVERHSALLDQMRDAARLQDVLLLIPQLDAIEIEVGKASAPIAFRGRGEDQWAFLPGSGLRRRVVRHSQGRWVHQVRLPQLPQVHRQGRRGEWLLRHRHQQQGVDPQAAGALGVWPEVVLQLLHGALQDHDGHAH